MSSKNNIQGERMTAEWRYMALLANVTLSEAVGGRSAILAPVQDRRVQRLIHEHPRLGVFLEKFHDAFGQPVSPSVILLKTASQRQKPIDMIASFRDSVSVSVVSYARTRELNGGTVSLLPRFTNAFSIYPWNLDRHYQDLVCNTPSLAGLHRLAAFKGQSSPEVFPSTIHGHDVDQPLLTELLARWSRRYRSAKPTWADLALFRSLNMANQAMMMPAAADTTLFDVGRLLGHWVSAFEILVHPEDSNVTREKVYDFLDGIAWLRSISAEMDSIPHGTKPGGKKRTLAAFLYGALLKARNDFLHGNAVTAATLKTPGGGSLLWAAAPLYRLALTRFLGLSAPPLSQQRDDRKWLGEEMALHGEYNRYQRKAEDALIVACKGNAAVSATRRRQTPR